MAKRDDLEMLTKCFSELETGTYWEPNEDYYVHIDIVRGSLSNAPYAINSFMLTQDAFDPRRSLQFPTDLMTEDEAATERRLNRPVVAIRRRVLGIGNKYYEYWKVRKNFSPERFDEMIKQLAGMVEVRLVRIIDNDHEITIYRSNALLDIMAQKQ